MEAENMLGYLPEQVHRAWILSEKWASLRAAHANFPGIPTFKKKTEYEHMYTEQKKIK